MNNMKLHLELYDKRDVCKIFGDFKPENVNIIRLFDKKPHLVLNNDEILPGGCITTHCINVGDKLTITGIE